MEYLKGKDWVSIRELQKQDWYNSKLYYQLESLETGNFIERKKIEGISCVRMKLIKKTERK